MKLKFWGVRGSIPSPGAETAYHGGNTSCVEIGCGATRLILDAGTGLRGLGNAILAAGDSRHHHVLLSHLHWDHIQGLPFFTPIYLGDHRLEIRGPGADDAALRAAIASQMTAPTFPIPFDMVRPRVACHAVHDGDRFPVGDAMVVARALNHPGGVLGYRVEYGGRAIVYATDTEHVVGQEPDAALLELAQGADVLVYDSMYTPEEHRGDVGPSKVGWGHSTFEAGAVVARAAGVRELVLFHHDPQRSDAAIGDLLRRARELFPRVSAAREGATIELAPASQAA